MGRAHEVRKASMAKTAAAKTKVYSRFGKEIYMAAKAGVPDPEMNQGLKRKIEQAKANQVPTDVIKRAIDKAKGGSGENYEECRYEGFGPGASTIVIDCLTDNTNRSISDIKTCFNKAKCKVGVSGSVSHSYEAFGLFSFKYEDEETMLDTLIMAEVDVKDIEIEDGVMTVYVEPNDFHKTQVAIEGIIEGVEFDICEITLIPNEYVKIEDAEEKDLWTRLITLLEQVDDIKQIYHNVEE